jgi:hypothetical protein
MNQSLVHMQMHHDHADVVFGLAELGVHEGAVPVHANFDCGGLLCVTSGPTAQPPHDRYMTPGAAEPVGTEDSVCVEGSCRPIASRRVSGCRGRLVLAWWARRWTVPKLGDPVGERERNGADGDADDDVACQGEGHGAEGDGDDDGEQSDGSSRVG